MQRLLPAFVGTPVLAFLVALVVPRKKERMLSGLVISIVSVYFIGLLAFLTKWMMDGFPVLNLKFLPLYTSENFEFILDFYFDYYTAVYLFVGGLITGIIVIFSKYYLHREEGFKRFFVTLLVFFTGFNLVVLSGNFETLFTGWEFVGIASFLLIAFYRDRYLPVKNALKVISIYRLGDICLIVAMWMSHHLWHENITFLKLNGSGTAAFLAQHPAEVFTIALLLLIGAATKSAQLPFTSWLPRAMEGPTSSSGIFYGSLSVSLGIFLLLRTYPLWENVLPIKIILIVTGAATAVVATLIARVQPTVKTQIAYASAAQLGLIFIEVALGWHVLALIHFAGNAFLRTYQLLVSPSVLGYLVHEQFFSFKPRASGKAPGKLLQAFYVLSIKEWNLDRFLSRTLWKPFKFIGSRLGFLGSNSMAILLLLLFVFGAMIYVAQSDRFGLLLPEKMQHYLPPAFAFIGVLAVLCAFAERGSALRSWTLAVAAQFFAGLAIALNDRFEPLQVLLFVSGLLLAAVAGWLALRRLEKLEKDIQLNRFHGNAYEHPKLAAVFLLCCLGLLGFPITASFVGIDLFFTHIGHHQYALLIPVSLVIAFVELTVLRMYVRLFLGQHKKTDHPIAYRSS